MSAIRLIEATLSGSVSKKGKAQIIVSTPEGTETHHVQRDKHGRWLGRNTAYNMKLRRQALSDMLQKAARTELQLRGAKIDRDTAKQALELARAALLEAPKSLQAREERDRQKQAYRSASRRVRRLQTRAEELGEEYQSILRRFPTMVEYTF